MVNPSKQKGTAWETACLRYARENGHPFAHRQPLTGNKDQGDIWLPGGILIEAKNCARLDLAGWVDQTEVEVVNANARFGVSWVKRRGKSSPGDGYVIMNGRTFVRMAE